MVSLWARLSEAERRKVLIKATYSDKYAILNWNELTPGIRDDVWEVLHGRKSFSQRRMEGTLSRNKRYRGYGY